MKIWSWKSIKHLDLSLKRLMAQHLKTFLGFTRVSIISQAWLRAGWDAKHVYTFTWLGRPIIQLPEDIIRLQETIYSLRPDVIVETGVAHGGSAVFFASLCKLMGKGRVITVDIDIREHNREAIERHDLSEYITLIEGDLSNHRERSPWQAKQIRCLFFLTQTIQKSCTSRIRSI